MILLNAHMQGVVAHTHLQKTQKNKEKLNEITLNTTIYINTTTSLRHSHYAVLYATDKKQM